MKGQQVHQQATVNRMKCRTFALLDQPSWPLSLLLIMGISLCLSDSWAAEATDILGEKEWAFSYVEKSTGTNPSTGEIIVYSSGRVLRCIKSGVGDKMEWKVDAEWFADKGLIAIFGFAVKQLTSEERGESAVNDAPLNANRIVLKPLPVDSGYSEVTIRRGSVKTAWRETETRFFEPDIRLLVGYLSEAYGKGLDQPPPPSPK